MAIKIVNDDSLTAVANAIRVKAEITGTLEFPDGFVSAVENIPAGGGGSSDFSTATVTVNVNNDTAILYMAHVYDDTEVEVAIFESGTYNVVLYKGCALGSVVASGPSQVTVSGDIEADGTDVLITGNGTITIS